MGSANSQSRGEQSPPLCKHLNDAGQDAIQPEMTSDTCTAPPDSGRQVGSSSSTVNLQLNSEATHDCRRLDTRKELPGQERSPQLTSQCDQGWSAEPRMTSLMCTSSNHKPQAAPAYFSLLTGSSSMALASFCSFWRCTLLCSLAHTDAMKAQMALKLSTCQKGVFCRSAAPEDGKLRGSGAQQLNLAKTDLHSILGTGKGLLQELLVGAREPLPPKSNNNKLPRQRSTKKQSRGATTSF